MSFDGNYSVKWALGLKVYCLMNNSIELKILTLLTVCSLCVMANMSSQWPHGDELTKSTIVALIAWLHHGQQTKVEFNHREGYHYGFMDVKVVIMENGENTSSVTVSWMTSGQHIVRLGDLWTGSSRWRRHWAKSVPTLSNNAGFVWGGWNETLTEVIH